MSATNWNDVEFFIIRLFCVIYASEENLQCSFTDVFMTCGTEVRQEIVSAFTATHMCQNNTIVICYTKLIIESFLFTHSTVEKTVS